MVHTPRVFTIPASAPFLPTLIEALLDGRLVPGFGTTGDPLALADATIYLPTRGVSWDRLDDLVPDHLDKYWQLTIAFLKIARTAWPDILAERGMIEPVMRRDALIKAEAMRLARSPGPVIAAGSTGSIPATA